MRVRLKPIEAESLGLEVRLNEGTRNARYTISSEQFEKIKDLRLGSLKTQTEKDNIPLNDTKHLWLKTPEASYFITNPLYKKDEENSLFDRFTDIINSKECKYPKIKRTPSKDAHLLVVNPADIHIGKLPSVEISLRKYLELDHLEHLKNSRHLFRFCTCVIHYPTL